MHARGWGLARGAGCCPPVRSRAVSWLGGRAGGSIVPAPSGYERGGGTAGVRPRTARCAALWRTAYIHARLPGSSRCAPLRVLTWGDRTGDGTRRGAGQGGRDAGRGAAGRRRGSTSGTGARVGGGTPVLAVAGERDGAAAAPGAWDRRQGAAGPGARAGRARRGGAPGTPPPASAAGGGRGPAPRAGRWRGQRPVASTGRAMRVRRRDVRRRLRAGQAQDRLAVGRGSGDVCVWGRGPGQGAGPGRGLRPDPGRGRGRGGVGVNAATIRTATRVGALRELAREVGTRRGPRLRCGAAWPCAGLVPSAARQGRPGRPGQRTQG